MAHSPICTSGHFFSPIWLVKCLLRTASPTPQVAEHSLHALHSLVAQIPGSSAATDRSDSSPPARSPLRETTSVTCRVPLPPRVDGKGGTHSHSATAATHISLETSCRSQPNVCAFCGMR